MIRRKEPLMKNTEFIAYDDLRGKPAFQMAMQKANGKYYLYTASYRDNGMNILDVTDPAKPRNLKWFEGPWFFDARDGQLMFKIQVAEGILITAHCQGFSFLMGNEDGLPAWGGITIWDVKTDPETPRFLGKFECSGGIGVHRFFYNGGRYVYLPGACEGYLGWILRIVDIKDPTNPVEVGRYIAPEQLESMSKFAGPWDRPTEQPWVHAVTVKDDIAYVAYNNVGFVLLDVKDKSNPKFLAKIPINPTFGGVYSGAGVHSAYPLGDRPYAVVSTEGERASFNDGKRENVFPGGIVKYQPMNMIGMIEISDLTHPSLISIFPYPEMPEGYNHGNNFNFVEGIRVPLGPHNCFDAFGPDVYKKLENKVLNCYFHAGLRIYDVTDPFVPKEVGYFLPPDPEKKLYTGQDDSFEPGHLISITEDLVVDDRGYIYISMHQDGLYIVRYTGEEGL